MKKRILLRPKSSQMGVYNPTVCGNYIFYRVEDYHMMQTVVGVEYRVNKGKIEIIAGTEKVVLKREHDYEAEGCEDPRAVTIKGRHYMTYVGVGLGRTTHTLCLAESNDLENWDKKGIILRPSKCGWDSHQVKAGAISPHPDNKGYYYMYYLGQEKPRHTKIGVVRSKNLYSWKRYRNSPIMLPRKGHFDSQGIEPCAVFYDEKRDADILIYAGWDKNFVHMSGIAVISRKSIPKLGYRRKKPFLEPEEKWEKHGTVPNIVFPTGIIRQKHGKILNVLWGAANKVIGEKPYSLEELLEEDTTGKIVIFKY